MDAWIAENISWLTENKYLNSAYLVLNAFALVYWAVAIKMIKLLIVHLLSWSRIGHHIFWTLVQSLQ